MLKMTFIYYLRVILIHWSIMMSADADMQQFNMSRECLYYNAVDHFLTLKKHWSGLL